MTPEQFKAWRKRLDFTQDDAADFLGVTAGTIGNYEAGQRRDGATVTIPKAIELACVAISLGFEDYIEKDDIITAAKTSGATETQKAAAKLAIAQDEKVYKGDVVGLQHKVKFLQREIKSLEDRNKLYDQCFKELYSVTGRPLPIAITVPLFG